MNPYTTDHPMAAQPAWFDARKHPRRARFGQVLAVALVVLAGFASIWIYAMIQADTIDEDVLDPTWADYVFLALAAISAFPALFILHFAGLTSDFYLWSGLVVDSFFWAWVVVSVYRMVRGWKSRDGRGVEGGLGSDRQRG